MVWFLFFRRPVDIAIIINPIVLDCVEEAVILLMDSITGNSDINRFSTVSVSDISFLT
jgi:hypothetical protein